jgi:hypothetical protein
MFFTLKKIILGVAVWNNLLGSFYNQNGFLNHIHNNNGASPDSHSYSNNSWSAIITHIPILTQVSASAAPAPVAYSTHPWAAIMTTHTPMLNQVSGDEGAAAPSIYHSHHSAFFGSDNDDMIGDSNTADAVLPLLLSPKLSTEITPVKITKIFFDKVFNDDPADSIYLDDLEHKVNSQVVVNQYKPVSYVTGENHDLNSKKETNSYGEQYSEEDDEESNKESDDSVCSFEKKMHACPIYNIFKESPIKDCPLYDLHGGLDKCPCCTFDKSVGASVSNTALDQKSSPIKEEAMIAEEAVAKEEDASQKQLLELFNFDFAALNLD